MILQERRQDLFMMPEEYYLAHCISADAKMGKGIALEFVKRFPLKPLQEQAKAKLLEVGKCYPVGRVCNLVTKLRYWQKPTYESMRESLTSLKEYLLEKNITKLAMPTIGCGLDRLRWNKVRGIIEEVFSDTEIVIIVCRL